jgi:hypothetical protein
MKKFLLIALSALFALPTMADDEVKNWNFTNNEDGECVVEVVIPTEKDQVSALKAVKIAINKISLAGREVVTANDSVLAYKLMKNTKMRYNPFAGNFTEDMAFNLVVTYSENSIKLHVTEPTIICSYSGYGSNVTSKSFATRIDDYNTYQEKLNDSSTKNKEKKECKEEIKNINSELNMCQKEFDEMIEIIKRAL